jgi:DNA-binding SARP family transcriptional activator
VLTVQMFGGFYMAANGKIVHGDLGANGRRLAAYLFTFPNAFHRRAKLIDLFWPDLDASQARAGFSTTLWRLRRQLARHVNPAKAELHVTARELSLTVLDDNIVDAHRFLTLLARAFPRAGSDPDVEALDEAVRLYMGPFLDGDDEDWILEQRERMHCLYVRALTETVRWLTEQNRYEDALVCGRRILACDPVRERIQRWVMLLYVLNGQRGEAVRQFERCERVLRDECDVEPMPETRQLAAVIRSGEVFGNLPELRQGMVAGGVHEPLLLTGRARPGQS